jgi:5-formyltetrahydrofolate cyclo-ligase
MLEKNRVRERMRAERRKVAPSVRRNASQEVCARILDRADVKGALAAKQPFAVYLASPQEIDLAPLIEHLWAADCLVLVPAWRNGVYALEPYSQKTTLIPGPMGILEPAPEGSVPNDSGSVPKVWLVPGLAFTRTGGRLGYGGGWYDRLLAGTDPSAILLGVAYPFQVVEELPSESHDIRLTDVVVAEGCA